MARLVLFGVAVALMLALSLAAAPSKLSETEYQYLFGKFLEQHGKSYGLAERGRRFEAFRDNLDFVMKHNHEAEQGMWSFTVGMNRFGDWTNDEYRQRVLGLNRNPAKASSVAPMAFEDKSVKDPPASFDWRKEGAVTAVKDQGQCGSCWAFSATAALEGAWFQKSGTLLSLSEQLCVDCVNGGAENCETGGEMHDCYLQVISQGGDETEADYPYRGDDGQGCLFDSSKAVATGFSYYVNVTQGDEAALQAASAQHVISVGIDASSPFFQFYFGGVYDPPFCKNQYYQLDHGVTVVGYDHDSKSGLDYWIVKNSWGKFWGMSGYIWMARNQDNKCGIATDATFPW